MAFSSFGNLGGATMEENVQSGPDLVDIQTEVRSAGTGFDEY
jgi:hypothetical protein